MNILFLSQVLPYPLDAGPKMRSYYVLRHLVQQHRVTLLTFVRGTDPPEAITHLSDLCHLVHTVPMRRSRWRDVKFLVQSLLTGQPFLITRDHVPAMAVQLRQLVSGEQFDAVHADQLWMAPYALQAKAWAPQVRLVLDQHNAVHLIPDRLAQDEPQSLKRAILAREARAMAHYEAAVCQRFDQVIWVTAEDRQVVEALPDARLEQVPAEVIPICVDPTQTAPVKRVAKPDRITFLGGLHWPPNARGIVWFAQQVFPQIRAVIPQARLTVIGKDPPAELGGEGIEVTGYVIDPSRYLAETAVFIVPLQAGGGMRVKILDAWQWQLPVVSTTIGAEGILARSGENLLLADTVETFAQAVIRVLQEPDLADKLAGNGRQTVLDAYDWQKIYRAWDTVYEPTPPKSEPVLAAAPSA